MKVALERFLKDLKLQLEATGIHPVDGEKFDLAVTDPEMLKHSQLAFYDPKNCDGFAELSADQQETVVKHMIDANKHVYPENVGKALWNSATHSLWAMYSAMAILKMKTHAQYIKDQYAYLDPIPVITAGAQDLEEAEEKGLKFVIPSCAPQVVDKRSYAFAKIYETFVDTMAQEADPLKGTYATEAMKEQYTPGMIAQFKTTQRELKARIALYEARIKVNTQSPEERDKDRIQLITVETELKKPAKEALEQQRNFIEIPAQIRHANKEITFNNPDRSYTLKMAQVIEQSATIEQLIETLPTDDSMHIILASLKDQMATLPKEPQHLLPHEYLHAIAENIDSNCHYDPTSLITRVDTNVLHFFQKAITELSHYRKNLENTTSALHEMKNQLGSLAQVLKELDRISSVISEIEQSLKTSLPILDFSAASKEELLDHQGILRNNIEALKASEKILMTQPFNNASLQHDFESGLKSLGFAEMQKKISAQSEQYHMQTQEIATQIRKRELAAAQGSVEGLAHLKQDADSLLGIYKNTQREVKGNTLRQATALRLAEESIDSIKKQYKPSIASTKAKVDQLNQELAASGILQNNVAITDIEELEALETQLLEAKSLLNISGIPVSEHQFEKLRELLDWDTEATNAWTWIKNNSTLNWLGRAASRSASLLNLSQSPEQPLVDVIDQRLTATVIAVTEIKSLNLELRKHQVRLARLNAAMEKDSESYLNKKMAAEHSIAEYKQKNAELQQDISIHSERSHSAIAGFEELLLNCLNTLKTAELTRDTLTSVKAQFDSLVKIGGYAFDINRMDSYREFKKLYPLKQEALKKSESAVISQPPRSRLEPVVEVAAMVPVKALDNSLYEKYFSLEPKNSGLATKYLAKRASTYAAFDKIDHVLTKGLNFFSCSSNKTKTDQQARIDYLAKIGHALEQYGNTNNTAFLRGAYNLVAAALNNPNAFPARATKGSKGYENSMQALLETFMTDLQRHPALEPVIRATTVARNDEENSVYCLPQ